MNLVQVQERLKNLPMQAVMQYANGMNPEVPPYLALGELQRRETAQKQMTNAQGAAQGPQPSVKEQVEQKAGLMALQNMQQQQGMQQIAQQAQGAPGPVPAGAPQPEPQPEAAMARGGLARAPVNFNFQHGGIVAFQAGGQPKVEAILRKPPQARTPEENAILERAGIKLQRQQIPQGSAVRKADETLSQVGPDIREYFTEGASRMSDEELANAPAVGGAQNERILRAMGVSKSAPPPAPAAPAAPAVSDRRLLNQADAAVRSAPAAPIADLKALAEQRQRQQGPRPAPAATAPAPAAPATSAAPAPDSMEAMLRAQMAQKPTVRTLQEQIAEQKAAREAAGMTEPAGAAQMERIRKMQEQYEATKPSGLDDLIRVFGQAGQYKGLSGTAPAYTANQAQKRAQDLAMAQKINELMGGVETTQRGEMKDISTGALAGMGVDRAAEAARQKDLMQVLGTARGQDVQAATQREGYKTQERGQDLTYKAAMAQVNAIAARNKLELTQNQRAMIADKAMDNVNAQLKANMKLQMEVGKNPMLLQDMVRRETDRLMAAAGGTTMPAAPGAGSPGGTSLKYNPKTGKIE